MIIYKINLIDLISSFLSDPPKSKSPKKHQKRITLTFQNHKLGDLFEVPNDRDEGLAHYIIGLDMRLIGSI